ncbi:hypothetical protein [Phreatobacter stygius]|uniref:Uncharacterized protein n=1 Tax=Phreatobacter stygius TaxID=1940610 RepID=A0A4D7BGE9_9HYPH|nr:hypothetical protein [Phreatobacter stygius]QCI66932.1 hypothetical protein E8M01_23425 [Phreatobacter stygius]
MAHQIHKSSVIVATLAVAATLMSMRHVEAQPATSSRRADATVQRQCHEAVQRRLPGSDTSMTLEYNKNALYFSCMQNGGTIPGSN